MLHQAVRNVSHTVAKVNNRIDPIAIHIFKYASNTVAITKGIHRRLHWVGMSSCSFLQKLALARHLGPGLGKGLWSHARIGGELLPLPSGVGPDPGNEALATTITTHKYTHF